jgi:hypothetical protein
MKTNEITETVYTAEQLQPGKMYIRIKDIAYIYGSHNMQEFLKANIGYYLEVDPSYLFNNQYNTQQLRLYDSQISEVINDLRAGLGTCKYCGAMIKAGEEETHYTTQEGKPCVGCFWFQSQLISTANYETSNQDGSKTEKTEVKTYHKKCSFKDGKTDCTHKECREYGVNWFTPENTYFLKYPRGVNHTKKRLLSIDEKPVKIGSYYLESYPELDYFRLYNARKTINFKFDGVFFYINNGIGFAQVKNLDIPDNLRDKLRKELKNLQ